jgi:hypothetical protein
MPWPFYTRARKRTAPLSQQRETSINQGAHARECFAGNDESQQVRGQRDRLFGYGLNELWFRIAAKGGFRHDQNGAVSVCPFP